jgi:hypothetical protein
MLVVASHLSLTELAGCDVSLASGMELVLVQTLKAKLMMG